MLGSRAYLNCSEYHRIYVLRLFDATCNIFLSPREFPFNDEPADAFKDISGFTPV